jgi:hypothetical protein
MTTEQAIGHFRFRAAALVQHGDMDELRELFAYCAAAAMMCDGEGALNEMEISLRDALRFARQNIRTGIFDDL